MLKKFKKKKLYCWCCDNSDNTGEGRLARVFLNELKNQNHIYILSNKNFFLNKIFFKFLNYKYLSPFVGIIVCWFFFLKNQRTAYVNYLPLWNIFLFLFLPPRTILGPITGGAQFNYSNFSIIRKYIFPLLYIVSQFFLNLRNVKIIFSTDLLKPFLFKSIIKKANFNYVFNFISVKKKKRKTIDFLIYYRKHHNKKKFFPLEEIEHLIKLKCKIHIIGDILRLKNVFNHGIVNNKKVQKLLEKTKYSFTSGENIYGLFTLECINNHVKLIINKTEKNKVKYYKKNFIFFNFSKFDSISSINDLNF